MTLSKADALQRYGRTEAESDDDALQPPPNGPQNGLPGGFGGLPNERTPATPLQTALQGVAKREEGSGRTTTPESGDAPQRAILTAFAKDTSKAAEAVKSLLAEEDPEKLKALSSKLIADLPTLIPDDPALAAVIAEAMAAEFSPDGRARTPSAPPPSGALANENPYRCPKCGKFSGFNGHCEKCGYTLDSDESQKRAERLMRHVLEGDMTKPVEALAYRDGLGQIDLDVGKLGIGTGMEHGKGISKINQKHGSQFSFIPHALAHGKIYRLRPGNDPNKPFDDSQRAIVDGSHTVFLDRKGTSRWSISSVYDDAKKVAKIERAAAK